MPEAYAIAQCAVRAFVALVFWFWSDPLRSLVKLVGQRVTSPNTLSLWAVLSVILGVTGPFDTYNGMTLGIRLIYWSGILALSIVMSAILKGLIDRHLQQVPPLWREALVVVSFAGAFTPTLHWLTVRIDHSPVADPMTGGQMFATVLAIAASATVFRLMLFPAEAETPNVSALPRFEKPAPLRLLARLPDVGAATVLRLTVRDHYVEVYLSDQTCHRILMRFSDAVNEMEGVPGVCTHRSHWVALAAVVRARRDKGRDTLILVDGTEIPVSRTYRPGVVQAGLIKVETD